MTQKSSPVTTRFTDNEVVQERACISPVTSGATEGHVGECTIKHRNWRCHRGQQPISGLGRLIDSRGSQSPRRKGLPTENARLPQWGQTRKTKESTRFAEKVGNDTEVGQTPNLNRPLLPTGTSVTMKCAALEQ